MSFACGFEQGKDRGDIAFELSSLCCHQTLADKAIFIACSQLMLLVVADLIMESGEAGTARANVC